MVYSNIHGEGGCGKFDYTCQCTVRCTHRRLYLIYSNLARVKSTLHIFDITWQLKSILQKANFSCARSASIAMMGMTKYIPFELSCQALHEYTFV